jgi:hypothetical protein
MCADGDANSHGGGQQYVAQARTFFDHGFVVTEHIDDLPRRGLSSLAISRSVVYRAADLDRRGRLSSTGRGLVKLQCRVAEEGECAVDVGVGRCLFGDANVAIEIRVVAKAGD